MKIIIEANIAKHIFGTDKPTVIQILKNKIVKNMIKNCTVMGVYQDTMNANDLNNIVIKLIPSLKGAHNGK